MLLELVSGSGISNIREEADIDILRPQTLTLKCWTCFWPRSLQFYSSFMRMREEKSWMCHAMQASQNHSIYLCDTPWLRWCNQSNQHWNMIILPQNCHYNLRNFQPLKLKLLPTISGQPQSSVYLWVHSLRELPSWFAETWWGWGGTGCSTWEGSGVTSARLVMSKYHREVRIAPGKQISVSGFGGEKILTTFGNMISMLIFNFVPSERWINHRWSQDMVAW